MISPKPLIEPSISQVAVPVFLELASQPIAQARRKAIDEAIHNPVSHLRPASVFRTEEYLGLRLGPPPGLSIVTLLWLWAQDVGASLPPRLNPEGRGHRVHAAHTAAYLDGVAHRVETEPGAQLPSRKGMRHEQQLFDAESGLFGEDSE